MHTLPILAEYLMSWSCSLWRFKFTIAWPDRLTVCPMAGRFKLRKYSRTSPEQGPVEIEANSSYCHDFSFWSYWQLDNFSIVHDRPWGCSAIRNYCKLFHILSLGLLYLAGSGINIHSWWLTSQYINIRISIFCGRVSLPAITLLLDKEARTELIRT